VTVAKSLRRHRAGRRAGGVLLRQAAYSFAALIAALYGRGRAFEATGETGRARQDYEEAYRLAPEDPDYRAAYLAGGPAPLISAVALALIGASIMGALGTRERRRLAYTWALMLAGLALSMWMFIYYSWWHSLGSTTNFRSRLAR
jgi:hypothetical protein